MGVFGGIKEAKFSEGGIYVLPGVYRVQITACKQIKTRTGKQAFIVECKILESTNPERLPGSQVTWMVTLDKEPALGNIKQFLAIALECGEDQITEEVCEFAVNEQANPLKDRIVRCSAINIQTKANRPFTKCKFFGDADKAGAEKDQKAQQAA